MKHFLENFDFSVDSYLEIFDRTKFLKNKFKNYESHNFLNGKTLVMIFENRAPEQGCLLKLECFN